MNTKSAWQARAASLGRVRIDAADLMADHGTRALAVAQHMAQVERNGRRISPALPAGHWGRVAERVRRRIVRQVREGVP